MEEKRTVRLAHLILPKTNTNWKIYTVSSSGAWQAIGSDENSVKLAFSAIVSSITMRYSLPAPAGFVFCQFY